MQSNKEFDYSKGVQDEHETVQDRLPRDIDEANMVMSLKDEYSETKRLKKLLRNH